MTWNHIHVTTMELDLSGMIVVVVRPATAVVSVRRSMVVAMAMAVMVNWNVRSARTGSERDAEAIQTEVRTSLGAAHAACCHQCHYN